MDISLFRSVAHQYEHLRDINTVAMMNTISHLIEDQVIENRLSIDFYAGFQKFSNFPEQMRRYSRLGTICRRVYVFGIPDCQPPVIPGIEFIELQPGSELSKEWFLLVNTSDFWTTLLARELDGREQTTGNRCFDGLWSYDEQVVERIALLLTQVLGNFYEPIQRRNHERQSEHITEISGNLLSQLEQAEETIQKHWKRLVTLQKLAEVSSGRVNNLIQQMANILHTLFGATGVAIVLKGSSNDYAVSAIAGEAAGKGQTMMPNNSISHQAIKQGQSIHIPDTLQYRQQDSLLPTARALMSAPINCRQTLGAITIGNHEAQFWNDDDLRTLTAAAQILANYLQETIQWSPRTQLSLNPNKRFQQYVAENRRSLSYLLAMHKKLRILGGLNQPQLEVLNQIEKAYISLITVNKLAKKVFESSPDISSAPQDISKPPPPPPPATTSL